MIIRLANRNEAASIGIGADEFIAGIGKIKERM
jgi:hypothetical protein